MSTPRYHCIDCSVWSMWDGRCGSPCDCGGWPERNPNEPACNRFTLDLDEVELQLRRPLTCADCTQCAGATCTAGCDPLHLITAGGVRKCKHFTFKECRPKYLN